MYAFECHKLSLGQRGQKFLTGLSCQIPKGQFTAIVGPNGAGKSSLLRCLAGLEDEAKEAVYLCERPLKSYTRLELAQLLAWSPESFQVPFAFTVRELVLMGGFPRHRGYPTRKDQAEVDKILARLRLAQKAECSVHALSSGELRKLMLARVLAQATPIILLDEPSANLDLAASLEVLCFLKKLSQEGISVCVCLHDIVMARRFADFTLVLREGQLVAAGPARQVLDAKLISDNFQVAVRFFDSPEGELMSINLKL